MQVELTNDEVNSVLMVLGDLPTKSNAFPLLVKIQQQFQAHLQAEAQLQNPQESGKEKGGKSK